MTTELTIPFLKKKIQELQSALFFAESDSILKMPTHVISAEVTDDKAQIWFVVPRPAQCVHQFDQEFPAKLDFFRKGKDFYLKIKGTAAIVSDETQITDALSPEIMQRVKNKEAVLMRVKIQHADYFEATPKPAQNWLQYSGVQLYNWLLNPEFDVKNPQLVTIPIRINQ
ncbi:MAG TPA: pyridoxamine 5'-phosphate oxidase family protein [Puia sp.]|nr:pyridoxamine 5'-phosphate oxidase family protein [Puia sp.]